MHTVGKASVLVPTVAFVEDGGSFIGTAQLLCVVADFLSATLFARLRNDGVTANVGIANTLYFGAFRAQR